MISLCATGNCSSARRISSWSARANNNDSGLSLAAGSGTSLSSSSRDTVCFNPLREVRKVLRRMRYIQARKFVPGVNDGKPFSALTYVSCTRSSASSRLCVSQCAKLYNGASKGMASASNISAFLRSSGTSQYNNSWKAKIFQVSEGVAGIDEEEGLVGVRLSDRPITP